MNCNDWLIGLGQSQKAVTLSMRDMQSQSGQRGAPWETIAAFSSNNMRVHECRFMNVNS
jgi:hypothetical protein